MLDKANNFMLLERGDSRLQHVGFVAMSREVAAEMPLTLTIDATSTRSMINKHEGVVPPSFLSTVNCQEALYALKNPRSLNVGLYAFDKQETSRHLNPLQMFVAGNRLLAALTRQGFQGDPVTIARQRATKAGKPLSKEAIRELEQQSYDSNPITPTFAMRRMLLTEGSMQRLGLVAPITHNTGKQTRNR